MAYAVRPPLSRRCQASVQAAPTMGVVEVFQAPLVYAVQTPARFRVLGLGLRVKQAYTVRPLTFPELRTNTLQRWVSFRDGCRQVCQGAWRKMLAVRPRGGEGPDVFKRRVIAHAREGWFLRWLRVCGMAGVEVPGVAAAGFEVG